MGVIPFEALKQKKVDVNYYINKGDVPAKNTDFEFTHWQEWNGEEREKYEQHNSRGVMIVKIFFSLWKLVFLLIVFAILWSIKSNSFEIYSLFALPFAFGVFWLFPSWLQKVVTTNAKEDSEAEIFVKTVYVVNDLRGSEVNRYYINVVEYDEYGNPALHRDLRSGKYTIYGKIAKLYLIRHKDGTEERTPDPTITQRKDKEYGTS